MTLATACRSIAVRAGVEPAASWWGNPDPTAAEIVEFAQEALAHVARAHDWQALLRTHTAALPGLPEATVALPADYGRLVPDTVWIAGRLEPVAGPLTDDEFEYLRQGLTRATVPVFRIAGGRIELLAAGATAANLTLRYITSSVVAPARAAWGADGDAALVDERLVVLMAVALWRDAKGLDARFAGAQFNEALSRAKAQDRPLGVMSLGGMPEGGTSPWANADGSVSVRP